MAQTLADLEAILDLEQLDDSIYRGRSPQTVLQRVFGGQVAAQALVAAGRTVAEGRQVHSLHGYFLRSGDPSIPIIYLVDRIRDGRSFTTRRVVAQQHGRAIFHMSASFQVPEEGFEHADPMPAVPDPDQLPSMTDDVGLLGELLRTEWGAVDLRHVAGFIHDDGHSRDDSSFDGHARVWVRARGPLPPDPLVDVCVLAYLSDMTLMSAALIPHRVSPAREGLMVVSLDHQMWFHRPFQADDWLLYDQISPSASGGRALAAGRFFTRDGKLIASVAQEGLIRRLDPHYREG